MAALSVRGQTVQGGRVLLRKAPLPSRVYPWSTRRHCGPLAFRCATEGSRSAKEGKGSQEGTGNHVWCPVPFCPPPWARRLRRRRRQCIRHVIANTLCPGEPFSPPAASRCIGGTACRQQTVKRKKTSAEGIRKRLPFVKRAFFSCFTSAYAADFRNYSSTFT